MHLLRKEIAKAYPQKIHYNLDHIDCLWEDGYDRKDLQLRNHSPRQEHSKLEEDEHSRKTDYYAEFERRENERIDDKRKQRRWQERKEQEERDEEGSEDEPYQEKCERDHKHE